MSDGEFIRAIQSEIAEAVKLGRMCDVCGEHDPRVPLEYGFVRDVPSWICALCKADLARWLS